MTTAAERNATATRAKSPNRASTHPIAATCKSVTVGPPSGFLRPTPPPLARQPLGRIKNPRASSCPTSSRAGLKQALAKGPSCKAPTPRPLRQAPPLRSASLPERHTLSGKPLPSGKDITHRPTKTRKHTLLAKEPATSTRIASNRPSRQPASKAAPYSSTIPITRPKAVAELWKKVAERTMSGKGKLPNYLAPTDASRARSAPSVVTTSTSGRESSAAEGPIETRTTVRPKDGEVFRVYAMRPRGITFPVSTQVSPSAHFASVFSRRDYADSYRHSRVWLELSQDDYSRIAEQFEIAIMLGENEAYFTRIAEEHLIRHDARQRLSKPDILILTHDTSRWGPNPPRKGDPGYGTDFGPPITDETLPRKSYNFNLNPDKTFMLSSTAFPLVVRHQLYGIDAHVKPGGICPYLTYEMKRTADMLQIEAENQIAAAAALWLHRRCALRIRANLARGLDGQPPCASLSGLSHYGIIIFGPRFSVWVSNPALRDEATGIAGENSVVGYPLRNLWQGSLDSADGVKHYVAWQNWIHSWALGPFLESVKRDVAALTNADEADDLSLVVEESIK